MNFFKKRKNNAETEKVETILDYLNAQMHEYCHDTNTSTQNYVSNVINHLQIQIDLYSSKLNRLRNISANLK